MSDLDRFKAFAKYLADISGSIFTSYYRAPIFIASKSVHSHVTIVGWKARRLMNAEIMSDLKNYRIAGEEFDKYNLDAEYLLIFVPIDGTKSFISGTVGFGT